MAIIKTIPLENATGEVAEICQKIKSYIGFVPNSMVILSANPFMEMEKEKIFLKFNRIEVNAIKPPNAA